MTTPPPDVEPLLARYDSVLQPTADDPRTAIAGTADDGRPVVITLDPGQVPALYDEIYDPAWHDTTDGTMEDRS